MILREQNVCLNAGDEAPDFSLPDSEGNEVALSDYRGEKNVLVVLHPGDANTKCKDHFKYYEQHLDEFERLDTQVIGINMDSVEANREWIDEIGDIGYPILADYSPLGDVTLKYDCFVPKEGYGKRAVFVVDKDGMLRYVEVMKGTGDVCPNMDKLLEVLESM
ncbi:redoxin domain-containing protein [Candidatus Thorarchaeota archaeon]|nr:MAG: redoxin domain-containing protein [Candidatus Thorarchaeota archaeon]